MLNKHLLNILFHSTLWRPICNLYNVILQDTLLPEFHIGEWLIWENMGVYSLSLCCTFNEYLILIVIPIIRKKING